MEMFGRLPPPDTVVRRANNLFDTVANQTLFKSSVALPPFVGQETTIPRKLCSALHSAAYGGSLDDVRDCLLDGNDIGAVDTHGDGVLSYAVAGGNVETLKFLLESDAPWHLVNKAGRNFVDLAFGRVNPSTLAMTFESKHPYQSGESVEGLIALPGAIGYIVTFDEKSETEFGFDFIKFKKELNKEMFFGSGKYTGCNSNVVQVL